MKTCLVTLAAVLAICCYVAGSTFFHPLMSDSRRIRINATREFTHILDYTNRTFNCPFAIGSPANITYNVFFHNICGFSIGTRSCCTNFELDEILPKLITQYSTNMNLECIDRVTKAICHQCLPDAKRFTSFIPSTGTYYFRVCRDECKAIFDSCRTFNNGTYVGLTYQEFCVRPTGILKYPPEISTRANNYSFPGNFTGLNEPCWSGVPTTSIFVSFVLTLALMMLL